MPFFSRLKELDGSEDGALREKWMALREKLVSEFQLVKDIGMEVASFKVSQYAFINFHGNQFYLTLDFMFNGKNRENDMLQAVSTRAAVGWTMRMQSPRILLLGSDNL
jgi:hypothetical protein